MSRSNLNDPIFGSPTTTEATDDAAPAVVAQVYAANQTVLVNIPATVGPWLDVNGVEYPQDSVQTARLPAGGVIQAADPITLAEFALLEVVTGASESVSAWVFSTDNMIAENGDKIILMDNHSVNLPSTTNLESVQFAPASGNWSSVAAGTGSFVPDAAWTFGNGAPEWVATTPVVLNQVINHVRLSDGENRKWVSNSARTTGGTWDATEEGNWTDQGQVQNLLFGSDVITAIANLDSKNWLLLSGGDSAPELDQRYLEVLDLPDPTTVNPGAAALVFGEVTSNLNGHYTAHTDGVDQSLAVSWVKG